MLTIIFGFDDDMDSAKVSIQKFSAKVSIE